MIERGSLALAVCDAGPLIHLDELGCLDLLNDFQAALVPPTVWREAIRHRPGMAAENLTRVEAPDTASLRVRALARLLALHPGELEALSVALERPGCIMLSDDTAARMAANQLGIIVHGTIGVLLRAIRRSRRSRLEVIELLHALPQRTSLHIKASLLREIISEVINLQP